MKTKFIWQRIKTVRKYLLLIFVVAFVSILIIDLWLIDIPAPIPKMDVLGSIYYKLCLAYISGFLFYFLNVHIPSYNSKVKTFRYINNKIVKINDISINLIISLKGSLGIRNEDYEVPSREEIEKLCENINPHNPATYGPLSIRFHNWFKLFNYIESETKKHIKELLFLKENLDTETMRLLTNIDNCIETHLNTSNGIPLGNQDLTFWVYGILEYRELTQKLVLHLNRNYKGYSNEYHFREIKERQRV